MLKIKNVKKYDKDNNMIIKEYSESLPNEYINFIVDKTPDTVCFENNYILKTQSSMIFIIFKDFFKFGLLSYLLYDFESKKIYTKKIKLPFPYGRINLPLDFRYGNTYFTSKNLYFSCNINNSKTTLRIYDNNFKSFLNYNLPFSFKLFTSLKNNEQNYNIYQLESKNKKKNYFLLSKTEYKENIQGESSFLNQIETFDDTNSSALFNIKRSNFTFKYNSLFFTSEDLSMEFYDSKKTTNNNPNISLKSNIYFNGNKYEFDNVSINRVISDNNRKLYVVSQSDNLVNLLLVPLEKKSLNVFPYTLKKEKFVFCEMSGILRINGKSFEIEDEISVLRIE